MKKFNAVSRVTQHKRVDSLLDEMHSLGFSIRDSLTMDQSRLSRTAQDTVQAMIPCWVSFGWVY